jgi:hypothetical protein
MWLAALKGAVLISRSQILDGKGAFIQYMRGTAKQREVFISPLFAQEHSELTHILEAAAKREDSRWTLLDEPSFRTRCKVKRARKTLTALACTSELGQDHRWPHGITVLRKQEFLQSFVQIDPAKSGTG